MTNVTRNARTQAIYREVNEGIALINAGWEIPELELLCECGTAGCIERIGLTSGQYEQLRSNPTHFVLRPSHEDDAVERIVRRSEEYLIVKNVGRAATIARQTDPRSGAR